LKAKAFIFSLVTDKYSLAWKLVFWANCGLLLYLTLSPMVYHGPLFPNIDKVYHFIGFAAFAGFLSLAYPRLKAWKVIVVGAMVGLLIEIAQHFIPSRAASIGDLAADVLGATFAVWVVFFVREKVASC
jgi:VanZ family protein